MKIKTAGLIGPALDWAVAKADGNAHKFIDEGFAPSTDWSQGGPIIERERISIAITGGGDWRAHGCDVGTAYGPTPLVAAMRCLVASKLGAEIGRAHV